VAPPPVKLRKLMHGAGHEGGARAGTENTLLAAGLGAACAVARRELAASATHLAAMRDRLQATFAARAAEDASATATTAAGVDAKKPFEIRVNGQPDDARRLPNTLSVSFRGVLASAVMAKVESRVACSAGAACHSHDDDRVSHVLRAMAVPLDYARGTLRLSVGKHTTKGEVDEAARLIIAAVESLL
jgi:cysteine desulfurase